MWYNSGMSSPLPEREFVPPVNDVDVISGAKSGEGRYTSITLLLRDANHKLFSLHIEATDSVKTVAGEEQANGDIEPTFYLPGPDFNVSDLQDVVREAGPNLLQRFLVAQAEDAA